jgi:hypothetical protein
MAGYGFHGKAGSRWTVKDWPEIATYGEILTGPEGGWLIFSQTGIIILTRRRGAYTLKVIEILL